MTDTLPKIREFLNSTNLKFEIMDCDPKLADTSEFCKEYGTATLEMKEGKGNVVIVDDVLASGGTLQVVNNLVENAGYTVKDNLVLIDLKYVPTIVDFTLDVKSLVQYE